MVDKKVLVSFSYYDRNTVMLFAFRSCSANQIIGTVWNDNCSSIVLTCGFNQKSDDGVQ